MKYLKLFNTETDYQSYKNGSGFITPNVSYINNASVYYNPRVIKLITFKIADRTHQAEEGMTWNDWIDSKYNTNGFYYDRAIRSPEGFIVVCDITDIIINNTHYSVSGGGSN